MPAPTKLVHVVGILAKPESVYATPVSLSNSADGQLMAMDSRDYGSPLTIAYAEDGDIGPAVGELGRIRRVKPSGRSATIPVPMHFRGGGAAYSASVLPSVHTLLKACGFDSTLDATGGSEKYTYTPTAAGGVGTSLTLECYSRGEKYPLAGVIGNFSIEAPNAKPPKWMFDFSGILSADPSDASVPAITYPLLAVDPPKAQGLAITIGSFTSNAVVRAVSFKQNREISARQALNVGDAHAGFVPWGRQPTMTVTVEAPAFQTTPFHHANGIDPLSLVKEAIVLAAAVQFGSTQYNKFKINMPTAQVVDARPGQDGPVATWELDIVAHSSTPIAKDDINFVMD